ncbi:MAG: SLC13 family permease [Peptococcaceae bacterium]|nr:SLC13 family permease [Peptococcaceae bacterium]
MATILNNKKLMIKLSITFIIPIIIACLPTTEVFTYQMKMAIAITVWMLMWSAFDLSNLAIPAIIWPALLVILNVVDAQTAFVSYIGTTMYGAIGCMLLANVLNECGLLQRVAYWVAIKCGGSFNKAVYAIFFATFAVSICTFASGSVVCAALSYGFVRAMDMLKTKEGAIIMMAGMLGASTVRMFLYYPVTMGPLLASVRAVDQDFTLSFMQLFKYNWPVLVFCLLFILLMQILGKTSQSKISGGKEYFIKKYNELGKITAKEKKALIGVIAILAWIITNPLHGLDCMYPFIFMPFILCMPGINVGDSKNIEDIPWSTILFFASCLAIGSVCGAVGITALIGSVASPMLSGMGVIGTLIGVLVFGIVANFAMTPVAMLAGFSGMLYSIAQSIGMNPLAVIFTFNHATDMVFLPYEYLTFLVFYAFGAMTMGQFFKYQLLKNIAYIAFFVAIIIPYWRLVGLV